MKISCILNWNWKKKRVEQLLCGDNCWNYKKNVGFYLFSYVGYGFYVVYKLIW